MDNSINEDREQCFKFLKCEVWLRNVISYGLSGSVSLVMTYLSSQNLLSSKHLYITLILQAISNLAIWLKSDVSLNNKLQETKKELKNQIETNHNIQRMSNHSSIQQIATPIDLPQLITDNNV